MDFGKKISFIPKKPLTKRTERARRPVGILLSVSLVIFFGTLAVYGGLYLYNMSLNSTLKEKTKEFEVERKKADPSSAVEEGERLQTKINEVKKLLNNHIALSNIFSVLEGLTLKSVVLSDLSVEREDLKDDNVNAGLGDKKQTASIPGFVIKTKGTVSSYASLAFQSDVLKEEIKKDKRIVGFVIEKPTLDGNGNVSFNLSMIVPEQVLLYKNTIKSNTESPQAVPPSSFDESQAKENDIVSQRVDELKKINADKNFRNVPPSTDSGIKKDATPSLFEKFIDSFKSYIK